MANDELITRRGSLTRIGTAVAGLLGVGGFEAAVADARGSGPAGVASGAIKCVLTPELTEGPYYIANEKLRRDITEGKPGTPLRLRLSVLDASTCKPIRGAAVDIWHCDASGVYSGVGDAGPTTTFMRGVQRTNTGGVASFETVYPGWYPGRTVHIHVKVHVGGNVVHTGQLYFPDGVTDAAYTRQPYARRAGRDTRNAVDAVFRNGGRNSLLRLQRSGSGYAGSITMGVQRS